MADIVDSSYSALNEFLMNLWEEGPVLPPDQGGRATFIATNFPQRDQSFQQV
jgi:hypothetical protein